MGYSRGRMTTAQVPHGAPASTSLKIQVEDLGSACSSVSAGILQCYGEAASVMFDRFHNQTPAKGSVRLNGEERPAEFSWRPPTADVKASHANELDATEDGAYAVSFLAAHRAAGYIVRKRAHHGSGSDWLMTREGEPPNDFVRLEVSGIAKNKPLGGRLNTKVTQLGNGDLDRPGLAVIVGFEAAEVVMQEVK
jgi:hypothetical protein